MGYSAARLAAAAGAGFTHRPGLRRLGKSCAGRSSYSSLDVTIHKDVQAYFADQPDFDGIVNMAGWVHHGTLTQTSMKTGTVPLQ